MSSDSATDNIDRVFQLKADLLSLLDLVQQKMDHRLGFVVTLVVHKCHRVSQVKHVLTKQGFLYDDEQVCRVAWRNIEDWIAAQMTVIELGMVKLEDVFLPYMTDQNGITYFDKLEKKGFLLTE
jgi:hypothetical protein